MIVECSKCKKHDCQNEISPGIYKCDYCKNLYEITQTWTKLEPKEVNYEIESHDEVIETLPDVLQEGYLGLERPKQKLILLKISPENLDNLAIAQRLEINNNTVARWLRNEIVKKILEYLEMEQLSKVRKLVVIGLADKVSKTLNILMDEIEKSDGKQKMEAIKTMLDYDTKNKTNNRQNDKALDFDTSLV